MALRACAENRMAARLMGIDVPRMTLLSFGLAALIAGISGIAVAPITSLEFDTGRFFTNFGFISVAIGGMGSFLGSVFGGLFLGVAEQLAAGYVSSLFANALALALLLAVLLWRPNGLFPAGPARRTDVRDEQRIYRAILRIEGKGGLVFGLCGPGPAAGAALAAARPQHPELAGHHRHPLHRRARPRRADGLRRAGEPRPGRVHGHRRLHRRDPGT